MVKYLIYKVTNKESGKVYIGKTSAGLTKRKQGHIATAKCLGKESSVFHRALNSYGEEAFEWEILLECSDHKHMAEQEECFIKHFNCQTPNGYNMAAGGGSYGFQRSPETKELLSVKMKELHKNPEYTATSSQEKYPRSSVRSSH
jgi:group I intron endonuclease